jgi:hypothetical protein
MIDSFCFITTVNYSHDNIRSEDDSIKQLKEGLANLSEEDAKADKLRRLPLFV